MGVLGDVPLVVDAGLAAWNKLIRVLLVAEAARLGVQAYILGEGDNRSAGL